MMKFNIRGGAGDSTKPNVNARPQDNLYLAVNSKWMEDNPIPADEPWKTSFDVVEKNGRDHLLKDLNNFASGKEKVPNIKNLDKAVEFFKIASDAQKRDSDGAQPIKADLDFLLSLHSLKQVNQNLKKLLFDFVLPFNLTVEPDYKNAQLNVVYFNRHDPILREPDNYKKDNAQKLLKIWQNQTTNLLVMAGIKEDQAASYAKNAVNFDSKLAKTCNSAEYNAKVENSYNPVSVEEFVKKSRHLDLDKLLHDCKLDEAKLIIVMELNYLNNFDHLFTEENFDELKGWLISIFVNNASQYLSHQFRKAALPLTKAMFGVEDISNDQRYAYDYTCQVFNDVLGQFYGRKYLGEKAKNDATEMVKNIVEVYRERLRANTWLSEATKKEAIKKLDNLGLKVGYPDHAQKFYDLFQVIPVKDEGTLYKNTKINDHIRKQDNFDQLKKPVDRTIWGFSPIIANACYNPSANDITLPALILQKPFYDLHQDRAVNYGGFGAVIGHEISHAFDNNGSQFDEKGNMKNWWQKEDYTEFNKLIQKEIALFDKVKVGNVTINGTLTVSENIGDQGGLTVAVKANAKEGGNAKVLFENFARVWETNAKPEFLELLTSLDVHSLPQARVNVQSQCQDEFYQAFDVKPGDGMWLEPAKRVVIW